MNDRVSKAMPLGPVRENKYMKPLEEKSIEGGELKPQAPPKGFNFKTTVMTIKIVLPAPPPQPNPSLGLRLVARLAGALEPRLARIAVNRGLWRDGHGFP